MKFENFNKGLNEEVKNKVVDDNTRNINHQRFSQLQKANNSKEEVKQSEVIANNDSKIEAENNEDEKDFERDFLQRVKEGSLVLPINLKKESEDFVEGEKNIEGEKDFSMELLQKKAEAGLLVLPEDIKKEIENLKKEIDSDYSIFRKNGDSELEKTMVEKENKIRRLEIASTDNKNKIENDYSKKGPENVTLIIAQEEKLIDALKNLKKDNLFLVPQARALIHKWNTANAADYFSDDKKIEEAIITVEKNKNNKKEDSVPAPVAEALVVEALVAEALVAEVPGKKAEGEFAEFDDMAKVLTQTEKMPQEKIVTEEKVDSKNEIKETNEKEDRKKRGTLFEKIKKNKTVKWVLLAVAAISAAFVGSQALKEKPASEKSSPKSEIPANDNTIDNQENTGGETLQLTPEDFNTAIGPEALEILKSINKDVRETINEDVGVIAKIVVLEKGDGVGLINDYKMHNSYKVNFIDGETGIIYRDLAAISKTVYEGNLVIENDKGEIFVVVFQGLKDSGLDGNEGVEYFSSKVEKNVDSESGVAQEGISKNVEVKDNIGSTENNVEGENEETIDNSPRVPESSTTIVSNVFNVEDFKNITPINLDSTLKAQKIQEAPGKETNVDTSSVDKETTPVIKENKVEEKVTTTSTKKPSFLNRVLKRLFTPKDKKVKDTTENTSNIKEQLSIGDENGEYKESVDVIFGKGGPEAPRSGLQSIESVETVSKKAPESNIGKSTNGANMESAETSTEQVEIEIGKGILTNKNESFDDGKNHETSTKNSRSRTDKIRDNLIREGMLFDSGSSERRHTVIDRDTLNVLNISLDTMKTGVITNNEVVREIAPSTDSASYVINKPEAPKKSVEGEVLGHLIMTKNADGSFSVQNMNGNHSTVIIDKSAAEGIEEGEYFKTADGKWSKVVEIVTVGKKITK